MSVIEAASAPKTAKKYDDLVYDVGMHKGEDSELYLKKGFRVIGFEADPDLATYCRRRFAEYVERGALVVVEGAIVERSDCEPSRDAIQFYRNNGNSVWGTVVGDWARRNERFGTSSDAIEVPAVEFSACLEQHGIPHYMKIDIEGMDTVCVRALRHFAEKPDYVSIEGDKVSFDKLVDDVTLLTALGYDGFKVVQQEGIARQIEPNPPKEGRYAGHVIQDGSSGLFGEELPSIWRPYKRLLAEYKLVFLQYILFGDDGKLRKYLFGRAIRKCLSTILRAPVPGWHDIHARHSSVRR